jgi:hypothetical protein
MLSPKDVVLLPNLQKGVRALRERMRILTTYDANFWVD